MQIKIFEEELDEVHKNRKDVVESIRAFIGRRPAFSAHPIQTDLPRLELIGVVSVEAEELSADFRKISNHFLGVTFQRLD